MKKYNLSDFTRGWIVGDFSPTILTTKEFEFAVKNYTTGEHEAKHLHKKAHEITVIVSGKYKMNGELLKSGDIVHLLPEDTVDFECLEGGATAVIKTPSAKNDKYLV